MKKNKRICVIGLGHFGSGLARSLAQYCDVLALDSDIQCINAISDHVQKARCLDARSFQALSSVVSSDFDEAIVSIGESLEASILATLHLKKIGVPIIRAKADNIDHAAILKAIGASAVVFPEQEAAERLAGQIINRNLLDFIPLSQEYRVIDLKPPSSFYGKTIVDLQIRKRFGVLIIAIKKDNGETFKFLPGPDYIIEPSDILVMIGREKSLLSLQEDAR